MTKTTLEAPSEADLTRILDSISTATSVRARRRTITHRFAAVAGAVALVAASTAGLLVVQQASSTMLNVAECYSAADLESAHWGAVRTDEEMPSGIPPLSVRVANATEMCATSWRFGTNSDDRSIEPGEFPVPPLVACTLPDGRIAVFPSNDPASVACAALGLPDPLR
jgi:hypothetical protein